LRPGGRSIAGRVRLDAGRFLGQIGRIGPMKKLLALFATALFAVNVHAADQAPLFNATLTMGKEQRFLLVSQPAGKSSGFLALGESFDGYQLKAFDAKASTLDLERDGQITKVTLVSSAAVGNAPAAVAPATIADAEQVFKVMRFDEMMSKMLDQQKKAIAPMLQQQMTQVAARMKLSPEEQQEFVEFQKKAFDDVMSSVMGPEVRSEMAKAYSEVFTKDELNSLANFYSTPAGQALVDKTPEVSAKMQAVIMPRMMQNMQKMSQSVREFATNLQAKHAAAAAGEASAPAPVPAPAPKSNP
jgi:hypothetical protein